MNATAARDGKWLHAPWAGALLQLMADPIAEFGEVDTLPGWPALGPALAQPSPRRRLGLLVAPLDAAGARDCIAAMADAPARLLLLPSATLADVAVLAEAWLDAKRLAGLIGRADLDAARAVHGAAGLAFAAGRARLMPPADPVLGAALPPVQPGAAMIGLAAGAVPASLAARLRLRRPAALWKTIADHAVDAPAGPAAGVAVRRLLREVGPEWSRWLA